MAQIKLSKSAYFHNLEQICAKVGDKARVFAVLKDNAYGHGLAQIAALASEFGLKTAVVRDESEAKSIESFFERIIILSHRANGAESTNAKFIYAINDFSNLEHIKSGSKVQITLDTLMHRHGLKKHELKEAFKLSKKRKINICGAYTHFCGADELSASFAIQNEMFLELKAYFKELCAEFGVKNPIFHLHNSAAVERDKNLANRDECVRVGIAQYGYAQFDESLELKPVLSLWASKLSQRRLERGECVGYGGVFCAKEPMDIATYDLGYGDGLLRYNGKGEFVFNAKDKMLGRMSMDSFSSDSLSDELCVINDANIWAKYFDTINYDILVKLSPSLERVVVE